MEFWMEKHPFYEGLSLPLDKLDDKRFSSFINCCSEFLFPGTEADITPPETHDNGFDYRRKISNTANDYVCIQSKQMVALITFQTLALELCKVAMASKVYDLNVKEYHLYSIKGANAQFASSNEADRRQKLLNEAKKHLSKPKKFIELRKSLKAMDIENDMLGSIVEKFLHDISHIVIRKHEDIESLLRTIDNDKLKLIISDFFRLRAGVYEVKPLPDFDKDAYIKKSCDQIVSNVSNTIEFDLYLDTSDTLLNYKYSLDDSSKPKEIQIINIREWVSSIRAKMVRFISSKGGYGKTTTSWQILQYAVKMYNDDSTNFLPVRIQCNTYHGDIQALINRALSLRFGEFTQIEAEILLILDGLDEIHKDKQIQLLTEVYSFVENYRVSCIITLREFTIEYNQISKKNHESYGITQISLRQMSDICRKNNFPDSRIQDFVFTYIDRFKLVDIVYSPFMFVKALQLYITSEVVPNSIYDLLEKYIESRYIRNLDQIKDSSLNTYTLSDYYSIYELIAKFMLTNDVSGITLTQMQSLNKCALKGLDRNELDTLLTHFEIMHKMTNGEYVFCHQILTDFFLSRSMAVDDLKRMYESRRDCELLILLTITKLSSEAVDELINYLVTRDLILATKCSLDFPDCMETIIRPIIEEKYQSVRLFDTWESIYSMALINSDEYKKFLLNEYEHLTDGEVRKAFIYRALLIMGEESICLKELNEKELYESFPGKVTITPDPWHLIPLRLRYDLALNRIKGILADDLQNYSEFKNGISFSLKFINSIKVSSEFIFLCKEILLVTDKLKSFHIFYYAFFVILENDWDSSREFLVQQLKHIGGVELLDVYISAYKQDRVLFDSETIEQVIDFYYKACTEIEELHTSKKSLTDNKMDYLFEESNRQSIIEKCHEMFELIDLDKTALDKLYVYFTKSKRLMHEYNIWNLFGRYKHAPLLDLIPSILSSNDILKCSLLTVYLEQAQLIPMYADEYVKLLDLFELKFYSYEIRLILLYLEKCTKCDFLLKFVEPRLRAVLYQNEDLSKFEDIHDSNAEYRTIPHGIVTYITIYLSHSKQIDKDMLIQVLLRTDIQHVNEHELVWDKLFDHLSAESLEAIYDDVSNLKDPFVIIAIKKKYDGKLKLTNVAIEILENRILRVWGDALTALWQDSIVNKAIEVLIKVSQAPSNDDEMRFFRDLNSIITKHQAESIIGPYIQNNPGLPSDVQLTLDLWFDVGIRKRTVV